MKQKMSEDTGLSPIYISSITGNAEERQLLSRLRVNRIKSIPRLELNFTDICSD